MFDPLDVKNCQYDENLTQNMIAYDHTFEYNNIFTHKLCLLETLLTEIQHSSWKILCQYSEMNNLRIFNPLCI